MSITKITPRMQSALRSGAPLQYFAHLWPRVLSAAVDTDEELRASWIRNNIDLDYTLGWARLPIIPGQYNLDQAAYDSEMQLSYTQGYGWVPIFCGQEITINPGLNLSKITTRVHVAAGGGAYVGAALYNTDPRLTTTVWARGFFWYLLPGMIWNQVVVKAGSFNGEVEFNLDLDLPAGKYYLVQFQGAQSYQHSVWYKAADSYAGGQMFVGTINGQDELHSISVGWANYPSYDMFFKLTLSGFASSGRLLTDIMDLGEIPSEAGILNLGVDIPLGTAIDITLTGLEQAVPDVVLSPDIDMMEYATDAAAQAAYVTNSTDLINDGTGGTITHSGGYTIHKFTADGTFNPVIARTVEYLIVAGGGGGGGSAASTGGGSGGGGAGGVLSGSSAVTATNYGVTVGAGGPGGAAVNYTPGTSGNISVFNSITATGGGGGGAGTTNGISGGSGGGSGYNSTGGNGTGGQGYNGGSSNTGSPYAASGGGGAGAVGNAAAANNIGGAGGVGVSSSISGSPVTYGCGGGGAGGYTGTYTGGAGGCSSAGAGGSDTSPTGANATANFGGGGGGGVGGGNGGYGVVIVRYLTTYKLEAFSEAVLMTQGSYALKGVALITASLNKTLTRTVSPVIDLTDRTTINFDIRASRTGSNIKIGIHDSGGTTTEITPNIASADVYQAVAWDISGVSNANKDAIDSIIITIVNADADNTFYIDNMHADYPPDPDPPLTALITNAVDGTELPAGLRYWQADITLYSDGAHSLTPQMDFIEVQYPKNTLKLRVKGRKLNNVARDILANYTPMLTEPEFAMSEIKPIERISSGGEATCDLEDPTGEVIQQLVSDSPLLNFSGKLFVGADVPGFCEGDLLQFFIGTISGVTYKPKYRKGFAGLTLKFINPILQLKSKVPGTVEQGILALADIAINQDGLHVMDSMLALMRQNSDSDMPGIQGRYINVQSFQAGKTTIGDDFLSAEAYLVRRSNAAGLPDTRIKSPDERQKFLGQLCMIADGYITIDEASRITFVAHDTDAAYEADWADETMVHKAGVDAIPIEAIDSFDLGYDSRFFNVAFMGAEGDASGDDWTAFSKIYCGANADSIEEFGPGKTRAYSLMEKNMIDASKWLGPQSEYNGESIAWALVQRYVERYGYPPVICKGVVVPNSQFMRTPGSVIRMWSKEFVKFKRRGIALSETKKFMVLSKKIDKTKNRMVFDLLELT